MYGLHSRMSARSGNILLRQSEWMYLNEFNDSRMILYFKLRRIAKKNTSPPTEPWSRLRQNGGFVIRFLSLSYPMVHWAFFFFFHFLYLYRFEFFFQIPVVHHGSQCAFGRRSKYSSKKKFFIRSTGESVRYNFPKFFVQLCGVREMTIFYEWKLF